MKLSWIRWVVRTTAYRRPWVSSIFCFSACLPSKKVCVLAHGLGWGREGGWGNCVHFNLHTHLMLCQAWGEVGWANHLHFNLHTYLWRGGVGPRSLQNCLQTLFLSTKPRHRGSISSLGCTANSCEGWPSLSSHDPQSHPQWMWMTELVQTLHKQP